MIDWSYGLLSEPERVLLNRLSVFAGGWTLEAAEYVCADDVGAHGRAPLRSADILDLMLRLVDKSLVILDEQSPSTGSGQAGESRYRMLETIRQYARDKLLESGEVELVRTCHLDYFVQFTEQGEPLFDGPEQINWLNRLEIEHDNLRAAFAWSVANPQRTEPGMRLGSAIKILWVAHDHHGEAIRWIEQLMARQLAASDTVRAKFLGGTSLIVQQVGDWARARAILEEGLLIFRDLNNVQALLLHCAG